MSSSSSQSWALLLLRVAVGLGFVLHGISAVHGGGPAPTFANLSRWGWILFELGGGGLMVLGLLMPWVCVPLILLLGWPLVNGWTHGAGLLSHAEGLLHLLTLLASAIGGPGKWAIQKG